jgi:hypothetical protein
MKSKLKADWIAALRSGNYKQAKHALTNGEGFCCLGVLCEVETLDKKFQADGEFWSYVFEGEEYEENIEGGFQNEVGLSNDQIDQLVIMNDTYDKNFNEIADWIEENVSVDDAGTEG